MSIAISHNMDNINFIEQKDLAKYMGLTKGGTTGAEEMDASESKKMTVDTANKTITYKYKRGGVTLQAVINIADQSMAWTADGVTQGDNRHTALREGLKLATDTDLTVGNITW